jgi:hypothetical protein
MCQCQVRKAYEYGFVQKKQEASIIHSPTDLKQVWTAQFKKINLKMSSQLEQQIKVLTKIFRLTKSGAIPIFHKFSRPCTNNINPRK